jgi:Domain of unknown function (DU1801)
MKPFSSPAVAHAFEACPTKVRRKLLALRELILRTGASTEGVGELEETLRWGEPAYVTVETGSGSTVRIGWKQSRPTEYAIYFNCQTTLVESFRAIFPNEFRYEGNRAIVFDESERVPTKALEFCVTTALTYHRRNRVGARGRGPRSSP